MNMPDSARPAPRLALAAAIAVALALAATAHASVRFEPMPDAFVGGPSQVGVDLVRSGSATVVRLVPVARSVLPAVATGLTGSVPTTAIGATDAVGALNLSQDLRTHPGGVVLLHEGASLSEVVDAYRRALVDLGYAPQLDASSGSGHLLTFVSGDQTLRVAASRDGADVLVYLGR